MHPFDVGTATIASSQRHLPRYRFFREKNRTDKAYFNFAIAQPGNVVALPEPQLGD
jgi:hypothetical protein